MKNTTPSSFLMIPRNIVSNINFKNDMRLLKTYIYLFALARYKDTVIDGITVSKYQILMSKPQLARELQLSASELRTVLGKFEKMGGITRENIRNKYTRITLTKAFLTGDFPDRAMFPAPREKHSRGHCDKASAEEQKPLNKEKQQPQKTEQKKEGESEAAPTEKKKPYGRFGNVFLTDCEYKTLSAEVPDAEFLINNLSASLANTPGKYYPNHYALLYKNHINGQKPHGNKNAPPSSSPPYISFESAPPSYDLARIEERARTSVPKLKKRPKREEQSALLSGSRK